jgi:hypothetical protein
MITMAKKVKTAMVGVDALTLQAMELTRTQKYEEACDAYTKALGLRSKNAHELLANRAGLKLKLQNFESAKMDCEAALALQPSFAKAHTRLGLALACMGDDEGAVHRYILALELQPGDVTTFRLMSESEKRLEHRKRQRESDEHRRRSEEAEAAGRARLEMYKAYQRAMMESPAPPPAPATTLTSAAPAMQKHRRRHFGLSDMAKIEIGDMITADDATCIACIAEEVKGAPEVQQEQTECNAHTEPTPLDDLAALERCMPIPEPPIRQWAAPPFKAEVGEASEEAPPRGIDVKSVPSLQKNDLTVTCESRGSLKPSKAHLGRSKTQTMVRTIGGSNASRTAVKLPVSAIKTKQGLDPSVSAMKKGIELEPAPKRQPQTLGNGRKGDIKTRPTPTPSALGKGKNSRPSQLSPSPSRTQAPPISPLRRSTPANAKPIPRLPKDVKKAEEAVIGWMQMILQEQLSCDFADWLADGSRLVKLASCVSGRRELRPARRGGAAAASKNFEAFIRTCIDLRMPPSRLFDPLDFAQKGSHRKLIVCLFTLAVMTGGLSPVA